LQDSQTFLFKALHSWFRSNLTQSPFGISSCIGNGKRLSWLPIDTTTATKRGKIGTNGHLVSREFVKGNKIIIMTQVGKQMVARSSGTLEQAYIKIHRCQYSYFYLLSPLRSVSIEKCKNITVVLGPVEVAIMISGCENITVIAPCGRIVIGNSSLCTLNLLTPCRPLLLPGCEAISLGPYNTFYPKLEDHMKKVMIPATINLWDQPVMAGHDTHGESSSTWFLLPPTDFAQFIIPFEMEGKTTSIPFPLPSAYKKALDVKNKEYKQWLKSVNESTQDVEKKQSFQALVEQQFQEWLAETGHKKEIDAIVQHIDGKFKFDSKR